MLCKIEHFVYLLYVVFSHKLIDVNEIIFVIN